MLKIKPLCRLGYMDYAVIERTFEMPIAGPHADKNNEQLMGTGRKQGDQPTTA